MYATVITCTASQCIKAVIRAGVFKLHSWVLQVSLPVVRKFVKQVEESALGVKVVKGVRPDQQLVKVVNDELIDLMGGEQQGLVSPAKGPQVTFRLYTGPAAAPVCMRHQHCCTNDSTRDLLFSKG